MRRVPALICLLAVAGACAAPTAARAAEPTAADVQRAEDQGVREIIVARDPGLDAAQRGELRSGAGVTHVSDLSLPDTEVVRAPAGGLTEAIAALEAEPGVRYAEPNGIVRAASNDPAFAQQWALENLGQAVNGVPGTIDADIDAPHAWTRTTGTTEVVGVVDSGLDVNQEDLTGAVWTNPAEAAGRPNVDDDKDGAVDDINGWNVRTGTTDVTDTGGHGTHVAGTIAARTDNGLGVAGVAPDAKVFPIVALGADGTGTPADLATAFDIAGKLRIPIVNASVQSPASAAVETAVRAHPGTLYVLAAGNDAANVDNAANSSLCQMQAANVICVGASDSNDRPASFSNVGAANVDLFAPGVDIASTFVPFAQCPAAPCYAFLSGTSQAAPQVSGTLALMRALDPTQTAQQLKDALLASVDKKAALAGLALSGGRLNAAVAVGVTPPPPPPPPPAAPATAPTGGATAVPTGVDAPVVPAASAAPAAAAASPAAAPPVAAVAAALGRPSISAGDLTARHPLTLRFTLDRAATVKLTISRGAKTVATVSVHGRKGANRYVLRTKAGGKRLARGRYRVRVQAAGAARAYTVNVTVR